MTWSFHQFSGSRRPFVWRITGATPGGKPLYEFVFGKMTRRSTNGKFGDFDFVIQHPGLYKVGNTKSDNGFRFVFARARVLRYRTLQSEADAIALARRLQAGEAIDDLAQEFADRFKWHFAYPSHSDR